MKVFTGQIRKFERTSTNQANPSGPLRNVSATSRGIAWLVDMPSYR